MKTTFDFEKPIADLQLQIEKSGTSSRKDESRYERYCVGATRKISER